MGPKLLLVPLPPAVPEAPGAAPGTPPPPTTTGYGETVTGNDEPANGCPVRLVLKPPEPPPPPLFDPPPPPPPTTRYSTVSPKSPRAVTLKSPDEVKI
jgi:hypothetical protein